MKLSPTTKLFSILLAGIFVASCGLVQQAEPTNTPQPEPTEPPAATVAPTATVEPTEIPTETPIPTPTEVPATATTAPSPTPEGAFKTDFDEAGELEQWLGFRIDPDNLRQVEGTGSRATVEIADGKFRFDIRDTFTWVYFIYQPLDTADVRLETEALNLGRNTNNVSLICRYSEAGWYEFNISNGGLYDIYRFDPNTRDYVTLGSGGTTSIVTGQGTNQYAIECNGEELSLFVNGGPAIKTVKDKTLTSGKVGISVSSFPVTPIILEFDYLEVSQP